MKMKPNEIKFLLGVYLISMIFTIVGKVQFYYIGVFWISVCSGMIVYKLYNNYELKKNEKRLPTKRWSW